MRKFALLPLFLGLSLAQLSFGQVRDLFAEFEEEAKAPASVPASSASVAPEATKAPATPAVAPESSAAKAPASSASKKSKAKSSSSKAVSSSSVILSSSSAVVVSSSSVEVSAPSSSSVAPVESSSSVEAAPAVAIVDTAVLDSAARDSLMREAAIAEAERVRAQADSSRRADSLAQAQAAGLTDVSSSSVAASSNSMSRRDLLGPVKVSKVHGIDELKGRYKNPRKALFLSLLVPGAGQLYVGGSTATYVRGGVYMALEVFMWSGWGYFSIYKYNQQVDKYKKFAKQHYSIGRYEDAMRDLYSAAGSLYPSTFNSRYMGTRKSFCEAIYGDATYGKCYQDDALFSDDKTHLNNFKDKDKSLGDEMKDFKRSFNKESELFQLISEGAYVRGWDDVKNGGTLAIDLNLEDEDAETVSLGESEHMLKYRSMRRDANDYADMQAWFIGGLILNHIVSAVDAALTANAHNKVLYEEDVSWYDHLHFDSGISFKDSFGWSVRANWGF
ncbi:DUF5683 domain-containing protein [Fibrobacter succinogenes]|uniref:DUF5683 domain-containing protein n=1 Tax=Fibrobacter succinogenes TaxID=833 RepID=A0A380RU62_FIBSU|nr:hypothetical protein [Fibrobacter succinogenes]PWJ36580.1 hypothetical protein IE02_0049 [Fibrobacter succinogenes subsp. elongatus]SUQ18829.1 hypothetical protein SAMN05661053_0049 [Fibrobacter succinogenes]